MKSLITLLLLLSFNARADYFDYENYDQVIADDLQECKEEVITQHGDVLDEYELYDEMRECEHDIEY